MKLVISTRVLIYCALLGVVLVVAGVVLGFRIFPGIVRSKVWENSVLKEGTRQWDFFMKIPVPFDLKVSFFNVENPEEILQGSKPRVREVGPYVYKLYRWKSDVEWISDENISYYDYTRLEFDKEASGKLSDEDEVTILNAPFNALILTVEAISPSILSAVDEALPLVLKQYNNLFMTATVRDILFDGIIFCENGAEEDFTSKTICSQFKKKVPETKPMEIVGNSISYAYLRYKNYTHLGRFTINSGRKVNEELSNLVQYENKTTLSTWKDEKSICNKIRGTTTFHPYVTPDIKFEVFGEDICRVLTMEYRNEETVKGVTGYKYATPRDSFNASKELEDNCYCLNRSRTLSGDFGCLNDGLAEMINCMGK